MSKRLHIGGFSTTTTAGDLAAAFARWGGGAASIPADEFGRPKRFGFIDVAEDQAEAAIRGMDGTELDGRTLSVCEALWREDNSGYGPRLRGYYSGGRGGFGEGGGGGGGRW